MLMSNSIFMGLRGFGSFINFAILPKLNYFDKKIPIIIKLETKYFYHLIIKVNWSDTSNKAVTS